MNELLSNLCILILVLWLFYQLWVTVRKILSSDQFKEWRDRIFRIGLLSLVIMSLSSIPIAPGVAKPTAQPEQARITPIYATDLPTHAPTQVPMLFETETPVNISDAELPTETPTLTPIFTPTPTTASPTIVTPTKTDTSVPTPASSKPVSSSQSPSRNNPPSSSNPPPNPPPPASSSSSVSPGLPGQRSSSSYSTHTVPANPAPPVSDLGSALAIFLSAIGTAILWRFGYK